MAHSDSESPNGAGPAGETDLETLVEVLQQENEALQAELAQVAITAAENERIWRHFTAIERILFRTRELDQLVEELLREIKTRFKPDQLILLLCHPDLLERFFPDISMESEPVGEGTWILPFPAETGKRLCGAAPSPFHLSNENVDSLLDYLPDEASEIRSGVVVPLCIHQILFGGLFLGSADEKRYRPEDATDLLEQLGVKIALCMDNCLTYEKVKQFAIQDPLTGLLNYFQIHTVLEREFRKARRRGKPLSLMVIDFNFLQEIDENLEIGNEILKHAAGLLKEILPKDECFLGRYGSDDFLVILPNVQEDEAREVVPYLSRTIRKSPYKHQKTAVLIQTAIGVGSLKEGVDRPRDLLDAAYIELIRLKMGQYDAGE